MTNRSYRFNPEPKQATFGALPAGDYTAIVVECGEPVFNDNNNWVLKVRLAVGPENATVFDNPWSRSEESATQDGRDGIAQFLIACGMAPAAGKAPNFAGCVGKKCRIKLKVEKATKGTMAGQDVNRVSLYYAPDKDKTARGVAGQTATQTEFEKARAAQGVAMKNAAAEPEPDNIPY